MISLYVLRSAKAKWFAFEAMDCGASFGFLIWRLCGRIKNPFFVRKPL